MSIKKYFKFSTYEYKDKHTKQFILEDSKVSGHLCLAIAIVAFSILTFLVVNPETRCDLSMDDVLKLILFAILGLIGYILSKIPIKNEKIWTYERKFLRVYLSGLFLIMSCYELIYSDAKADAMLIYLIYCTTAAIVLHINPIIYVLQTIFVMCIFIPVFLTYFNSIGTTFRLLFLLGWICFLVFYSNFKVHKRLLHADAQEQLRQQLEDELQAKTAEVILGMRRQTAIQENVILAIADLVENRDMDTGTHIKATSYYTRIIARNAVRLGYYTDDLSHDFIKLLEKAAPMHDLGKIMIPDEILKAPRRLTTEEFEIMKHHAPEGARIIRHIYAGIESQEYIDCAANIARYHHEKWNGNGYPEGISGLDIPLEARIMAIADVFDALVSKRCYKEAYPLSEAFDEIKNGAGSHFDPKLVDAFLLSKSTIEEMIVNNFD